MEKEQQPPRQPSTLHKRKAELQTALGHDGTTARMERFNAKRTRRINHYLHTASRAIIALLVAEGVGTLVVGKNPGWKQEAEMGKRNNQHKSGARTERSAPGQGFNDVSILTTIC